MNVPPLYPPVTPFTGSEGSSGSTSSNLTPQQELAQRCANILNYIEKNDCPVLATIDKKMSVLTLDFKIFDNHLQTMTSTNGRGLSPLPMERYKRRGFEGSIHPDLILSSIKKILSIFAFVLFAYKSKEIKNAELDNEPKTLISQINQLGLSFDNTNKSKKRVYQIIRQETLYTVMGNIIGSKEAITNQLMPGLAQSCVRAGFDLVKSLMVHRIRLLGIGAVTLLTAFTSYPILFKLGLLACAAYTIFMLVIYAKRVFDIGWKVDTLKLNIALVKDLIKKQPSS